jgi:hypothetical protein
LARRGVVRCSPCRAWLRAGLRAERFSFLQLLACAVTAWPGAPQRRSRASRSCARTPERRRAPRVSKPTERLNLLFAGLLCSGTRVCASDGGRKPPRLPCVSPEPTQAPGQPRHRRQKARRRGNALRTREPSNGRRRPLATYMNLAFGPHVAIRPNGVQLRPSVPVGSRSRIQGGPVDFGPLDQLGRAH